MQFPTDPPVPEPITIEDIQVALRDAWPSVDPVVVSFASGSTTISTIWHFTVEITLTTNPIVFGEKPNEARMSFQFKLPGQKALTLKSVRAFEYPAMRAFIQQCKMYLNGIVAAIEMAGEQPG